MSPDERRRILGSDCIAHIHALVEVAPEPPPDVVEALRRIFTNPAGETPGAARPSTVTSA
ncbi:hypothetical protein [Streptomyces lasiicapitis]|uniref:hypothetical protein n=1 Tax=Streptomyces lasiicapitis TaxID=1923961 RepID=UPI00368D0E86